MSVGMVEVVVSGHDLVAGEGVGADVGDVALEPGRVAGAFDQVPVHDRVGVDDLDEPVPLERALPVATASARSIMALIAWMSWR
jgi:hypothetical protein